MATRKVSPFRLVEGERVVKTEVRRTFSEKGREEECDGPTVQDELWSATY